MPPVIKIYATPVTNYRHDAEEFQIDIVGTIDYDVSLLSVAVVDSVLPALLKDSEIIVYLYMESAFSSEVFNSTRMSDWSKSTNVEDEDDDELNGERFSKNISVEYEGMHGATTWVNSHEVLKLPVHLEPLVMLEEFLRNSSNWKYNHHVGKSPKIIFKCRLDLE